jgi:hypothetical protein
MRSGRPRRALPIQTLTAGSEPARCHQSSADTERLTQGRASRQMRRAIIGATIVVGLAAAACNQAGNSLSVGPSGITAPAVLKQSTIAVLDQSERECDGACNVTKYENYPAEPPDPVYLVQSYNDPCTTKWGAGWTTEYLIWEGEPNDPWGPAPIHYCQ